VNLDASVSLTFDGDCEVAFKLYERVLGAKAEFVITSSASPLADDVPPEWHGKMLFARLRARQMTLLGGDLPPASYRRPTGFTLCLSADDEVEADRLFAALAEGGDRADGAAADLFCDAVRRSRRPFRHTVGDPMPEAARRCERMNEDRIASLLGEIRDNQKAALEQQRLQLEIARTHLDQAKAQVAESLKLQREAVGRARTAARIGLPAIVFCIAAILYLVFRYF
jgi:PhnB protein